MCAQKIIIPHAQGKDTLMLKPSLQEAENRPETRARSTGRGSNGGRADPRGPAVRQRQDCSS